MIDIQNLGFRSFHNGMKRKQHLLFENSLDILIPLTQLNFCLD